MSIFGGRKTAAAQPDYSGLALQTSTPAAPIPIVYGNTRSAPNLIWQDGVNARPLKGGGGAKGGGTTTGYDYSCWIMFGVCEGPIDAIGSEFSGQVVQSPSSGNLALLDGSTPQQPWGPALASYPAAALNYAGTAYMASPYYELGQTATLPSVAFEVYGRLYPDQAFVNDRDIDPASAIQDFLTNPQYGVGFPAAGLDAATLLGSPGDGSYRSWCTALGFAFSPAIASQETANTILARWLQITNATAVWSGGKLKVIPYGDTPIAVVPNTIVLPYQIAGQMGQISPSTPGQYVLPAIQVVPAARFVSDGGVINATTLAPLAEVTGTPQSGQYAQSGGLYQFAVPDEGQQVTITYTAVPAGSFAPNVTPLYDLGDDDFVYEDGNDPVEVSRVDPYAIGNVQRLECLDRSKQYAATPVEARDQNAIETFGLRIGSTVTAHEICDLAIGLISAQLILQRALYVRNTYAFKLSWEHCLLEPMDLVTLTDPGLGLAGTPVRIVAIEEGSDGVLAFTAEEFPGNASALGTYTQPATTTSTSINRNVAPAAVNAPVILEPPAPLTGDAPQLWAVVSGGANGVADPMWGGANVFLSSDGTSYSQVGTINAVGRQGVLTAALPAPGSGQAPDTASTLAVDLGASGGTLMSVSPADAQNAVTLCLVDHELIAFQTATLTAAGRYALTGLWRGLFGSAPAAHVAGAPFARLDAATFKYPLPAAAIGAALSLKFQSFNIYGGGVQDLSTCVAYPVTPIGSGLFGPTAQEIATGTSFDEGLASQPVSQSDDYGLASDPFSQGVDEGLASELVQSLAVGSGGTGATTSPGARQNIGAAASGANTDITSLAGLTTPLSLGQGGTGAGTAPAARAALGAAASGANADITSLTGLTTPLALAEGGTGAVTASAARQALAAAGSGANTDITALSGLATPLGVAQGGTGSASAAAARTALGAAASGQNADITGLSAVIKMQGAASGPQAITIDPATGHVGLAGYTADGNNGLGVLGTNFLFSAAVDSCRFTFNKAASANDASLTFETNFSARALAGLLGSDGYQLKVSPDGSTFHQVYVADQATGNAAFKALLSVASYPVAGLPAGSNGALAFAANGRKAGEAAGAGTGVVVAFSSGQWRRLSDDSVVVS